jgi:hypothetical protein
MHTALEDGRLGSKYSVFFASNAVLLKAVRPLFKRSAHQGRRPLFQRSAPQVKRSSSAALLLAKRSLSETLLKRSALPAKRSFTVKRSSSEALFQRSEASL